MNNQESIIEEYKLYVEMADRVSARRADTNKFYVSLLSALLAFIAFVYGKKICAGYEDVVLFSFSILGLLLNGVWFLNISTYRKLNSGKFKVIHQMEKKLPFACYDREWEILKKAGPKEYKTLTAVEKYVPLILSIPFLLLLIYSIYLFASPIPTSSI